jgi:hypothetical protein
MPKSKTYVTPDGWKIRNYFMPSFKASRSVKYHGSVAAAAKEAGITKAELRAQLRDHRLPPAPQITAEMAALLDRPHPVVDLPNPGEATEADLIRLCKLSIDIRRDYWTVECFLGNTFYCPPAHIRAWADAQWDLVKRIHEAAAAIPARTFEALKMKADTIMAIIDLEGDDDLDDEPMVISLLADCVGLPCKGSNPAHQTTAA